jgi:tRNA G18 (ribose-2'-O)-methylase SpoU
MRLESEIVIILDNIRSVYNVGSIFRTAECAGVREIYLCGKTPAPVDRFGRWRNDFKKVSLGAENNVKWHLKERIKDAIEELRQKNFFIVAVEQSKFAKNYQDISLPLKTAFVFGHEVSGVSKNALRLSDEIIEIPMKGNKESLNVSVSVGIILFCCGFHKISKSSSQ